MKFLYLFISLFSFSSGLFAQTETLGGNFSIKSHLAEKSLLLDIAKHEQKILAVGERGHILLSENLGNTWSQAEVPSQATLTSVVWVDHKIAWAVGHAGMVLRSSDGGWRWQVVLNGEQINAILTSAAEEQLRSLQAEKRIAPESVSLDQITQAEYLLEESVSLEEEGASRPLLKIWFKNRYEGYLLGAYGILLRTVDGGQTWLSWQQFIENDDLYHLYDLTVSDDGYLMVGEGGFIFRSIETTNQWRKLESPYFGSFFGISSNNDRSVQLAFGLRGNIFRSVNGGDSWQKVENTIIDSIADMSWLGPKHVVAVAAGGKVLESFDSGKTFSVRTHPDRLSFSALVAVSKSQFIAVGQGGIYHFASEQE